MASDQRAVFRLPAAALLLPVLAVLCVTPLATAGGAWAVLFAVPVVALAYVVHTRTVADPAFLTVHTLLGRKRMAWSEMDGLEFHGSRWAIAVGSDGTRVRLPMVRPRDLPRLAAVSGGSLAMAEPPPPPGAADGDAEGGTGAEAGTGVDAGTDGPRENPPGTPIGAAGRPPATPDVPDAGERVAPDSTAGAGGARDGGFRVGSAEGGGIVPGAAAASPGPPASPARDAD